MSIWTPNGNHVAALSPAPGDLFVVTTIGGKRVFVEPVSEYEKAIRLAEAFARATTQTRPFTIKVLCMSFSELLAHMGTTRDECAKALSDEDREADRQGSIDACMSLLRTSNDPQVRADALDILKEMGAMQ
jgi:hypothetical protein